MVDYFMVYNFQIWWMGAYRGMGRNCNEYRILKYKVHKTCSILVWGQYLNIFITITVMCTGSVAAEALGFSVNHVYRINLFGPFQAFSPSTSQLMGTTVKKAWCTKVFNMLACWGQLFIPKGHYFEDFYPKGSLFRIKDP